jgi:hypothetical protein
MNGKLREIRLGDRTVAEVSGPQLVPIGEGPNQQFRIGWFLITWLEHDKLLGQPPIGVGIPVAELWPQEALVEMITAKMLEQARDLRTMAERPPETPDAAAMMAELQRQAAAANGQPSS